MADTTTPNPPSPWLLGAFLAYFAGILPIFAWGLWRLVTDNTFPANAAPTVETSLVLTQGELLLAVMLAGGIGSYIHGVNSFVTYVGNRSFVSSWAPWYVLRPFMGIAMAVIFYVVVRGGVLVMSGGESKVDPYAMMTVAALAGMFSKQASDKLAEVFDTLFRSRADAERGDKLEKSELKLTAITPDKVNVGAAGVPITATGSGFAADSVVRLNRTDRPTTFKSATELTFTLTDADVAKPAVHKVTVFNPAGAGSTSEEKTLTVIGIPAPPMFGDAGAGQGGAEAGVGAGGGEAPHGEGGGDEGEAAG